MHQPEVQGFAKAGAAHEQILDAASVSVITA
jgi:hypothetical protein